jgi:hypothetical protein
MPGRVPLHERAAATAAADAALADAAAAWLDARAAGADDMTTRERALADALDGSRRARYRWERALRRYPPPPTT